MGMLGSLWWTILLGGWVYFLFSERGRAVVRGGWTLALCSPKILPFWRSVLYIFPLLIRYRGEVRKSFPALLPYLSCAMEPTNVNLFFDRADVILPRSPQLVSFAPVVFGPSYSAAFLRFLPFAMNLTKEQFAIVLEQVVKLRHDDIFFLLDHSDEVVPSIPYMLESDVFPFFADHLEGFVGFFPDVIEFLPELAPKFSQLKFAARHLDVLRPLVHHASQTPGLFARFMPYLDVFLRENVIGFVAKFSVVLDRHLGSMVDFLPLFFGFKYGSVLVADILPVLSDLTIPQMGHLLDAIRSLSEREAEQLMQIVVEHQSEVLPVLPRLSVTSLFALETVLSRVIPYLEVFCPLLVVFEPIIPEFLSHFLVLEQLVQLLVERQSFGLLVPFVSVLKEHLSTLCQFVPFVARYFDRILCENVVSALLTDSILNSLESLSAQEVEQFVPFLELVMDTRVLKRLSVDHYADQVTIRRSVFCRGGEMYSSRVDVRDGTEGWESIGNDSDVIVLREYVFEAQIVPSIGSFYPVMSHLVALLIQKFLREDVIIELLVRSAYFAPHISLFLPFVPVLAPHMSKLRSRDFEVLARNSYQLDHEDYLARVVLHMPTIMAHYDQLSEYFSVFFDDDGPTDGPFLVKELEEADMSALAFGSVGRSPSKTFTAIMENFDLLMSRLEYLAPHLEDIVPILPDLLPYLDVLCTNYLIILPLLHSVVFKSGRLIPWVGQLTAKMIPANQGTRLGELVRLLTSKTQETDRSKEKEGMKEKNVKEQRGTGGDWWDPTHWFGSRSNGSKRRLSKERRHAQSLPETEMVPVSPRFEPSVDALLLPGSDFEKVEVSRPRSTTSLLTRALGDKR